MFLGKRNTVGLTERQIEQCEMIWKAISGDKNVPLIVSEAMLYGSRTRFVEGRNVVYLGADAFPGQGPGANARFSLLACLAHEYSHFERYEREYKRPLEEPDVFIDEAETSLNASFNPLLSPKDRENLIEDARDRLDQWLQYQSNRN